MARREATTTDEAAVLIEAALHLAEDLKLPVLPLYSIAPDGVCTCRAAGSCRTPGKHPAVSGGVHGATLDRAKIEAWRRRRRGFNLGVAVGRRAKVCVLDVDPRHGGDQSLRDLEREHAELPTTPRTLTGGRGTHYWFRHPGGWLPNRTIAPGVELKAEALFVAVPPSRHPSGREYVWDAGAHPDDLPFAPLPAWVVEEALKRDGKGHSEADPAPHAGDATIPVGQRHSSLVSIGGAMRADGESVDGLKARLRAVKLDGEFPDRELDDIADWLGSRPAGPGGPTVRVPCRVLKAKLSPGARALYAVKQALAQITDGRVKQLTLAAVQGVTARTIRTCQAELEAAGLGSYKWPATWFVRVPVSVLIDPGLSFQAKSMAMDLLRAGDGQGRATAGIEAMAQARRTSASTVKRSLRELRELGHLKAQIAKFDAALGRRLRCNSYIFESAVAVAPQQARAQERKHVTHRDPGSARKRKQMTPESIRCVGDDLSAQGARRHGGVAPKRPTLPPADQEQVARAARATAVREIAARRGLTVAYVEDLVAAHGLQRVRAELGPGT